MHEACIILGISDVYREKLKRDSDTTKAVPIYKKEEICNEQNLNSVIVLPKLIYNIINRIPETQTRNDAPKNKFK